MWSELMGSVNLLEDNNMIVVKVGDVRVGGVSWQPEWRSEETDIKLEGLGRIGNDGGKIIEIGDWNAHHELYAYVGKCRWIVEWMNAEGLCLESTKGIATRYQGEHKLAVIDFTLVPDPEDWEERGESKNENEEEEERMSNHHLIWGTYKVEV